MKIMHLMLSNIYVDGYTYQENLLSRQNKIDGNDVVIIASTQSINNGKLVYLKPQKYTNNDGIPVIRVPYKISFMKQFFSKLRMYKNVYNLIKEFNPNIIMFHGIQSYELITVSKYIKKKPDVKFIVDVHSDMYNSAKTFFSKYILHKIYYKTIIKLAYKYIHRIYYINLESLDFIKKIYGISLAKTSFLPLGGFLYPTETRKIYRKNIRNKYLIDEDKLVFVHTGKMNLRKKTIELLESFVNTNSNKILLYLIGDISENIKSYANALIESDPRINYLPWLNGDDLIKFLCASDFYVQPGSQSATLQNAICAGCAIIVYPFESHKLYLKENGYFVSDSKQLMNLFNKIASLSSKKINIMKQNSIILAKKILDYEIIAKSIYN